MKEIKRDRYLKKLIDKEFDGLVKVITGIRRCGKSYLLFNLFKDHLLEEGVPEDHIIAVDLEDLSNIHLRDRNRLYEHVRSSILGKGGRFYILIDEIQHVDGFVDVVNGLTHLPETDVYITSSNSKFLSSDIMTEFRGRGEEIRVRPLSFSEFLPTFEGSSGEAWDEYMRYGGMPESIGFTAEHKESYLIDLVRSVYLLDITERNDVREPDSLESLMSALCSSVGSLTNTSKIMNTMSTTDHKKIDHKTVSRYLEIFQNSFLFERSQRYDVKGKRYFDSICKYYIADIGLRNAWLGYRQQEPTHMMENILYNELRTRGFNVDVGVVPVRKKNGDKLEYTQLEIDFIANKGYERIYIQSAFSVPDAEKHHQEIRPFLSTNDSFRKIIVVNGSDLPWMDENGIMTVGVIRFLLDETVI